MWFIGVEVEQETSALPPKKNPGSVPGQRARRQSLTDELRERERQRARNNRQSQRRRS